MVKISLYALPLGLLVLAGCIQMYPPTPNPDYAIHVASTPKGSVAIPPVCPGWAMATTDPYDNQLTPQFGCATARNLAMAVERPDDLLHGRNLGPERGVHGVGEIRRYDNDQTRGLLDPQTNVDSVAATTTSSTPASGLSGDATGGAGSSHASSSSGP